MMEQRTSCSSSLANVLSDHSDEDSLEKNQQDAKNSGKSCFETHRHPRVVSCK